jgi:integrase
MTLKVAEIKGLTKPGRYGDGNGLYFHVGKNGATSWVQRITVDGQRVDKGLGGFPKVSLPNARKLALANRAVVDRGGNPWADGKMQKASAKPAGVPTFREATYSVHAENSPRWRSVKGRTNWIQQMEKHVLPILGDTPVTEVTRADVLSILAPLRAVKQETARKMRQRISLVCKWSMSYGHIDLNPAGEVIAAALPRLPKAPNHHAALHYSEVPAAIQTIKDAVAMASTKLCFEFLILTAARSGEARGARWAEMDFAAGVWTIPAERSKDGKMHRKPLSIQAQVLLRYAKEKLEGETLVFPANGKDDKALSENALSLRARKDNLGCVPHGFRSSFRDWCEEEQQAGRLAGDRTAAEFCLSHNPLGQVEAAYLRSDLLEVRREIMQEWANVCQPLPF